MRERCHGDVDNEGRLVDGAARDRGAAGDEKDGAVQRDIFSVTALRAAMVGADQDEPVLFGVRLSTAQRVEHHLHLVVVVLDRRDVLFIGRIEAVAVAGVVDLVKVKEQKVGIASGQPSAGRLGHLDVGADLLLVIGETDDVLVDR